jgi:sulfur-oxidizing protein SoxB
MSNSSYTDLREMCYEGPKLVLEDGADTLFNEDLYGQQGGDMMRLGGLDYSIEPDGGAGTRFADMLLDDGPRIDASKSYKVSGWSTVGSQSSGAPIWEVVADYLRRSDSARITKLNTPG